MSTTECPRRERTMRIGEVAELTGTTPRTIRYYEEIGLLSGGTEREQGKHRCYTAGRRRADQGDRAPAGSARALASSSSRSCWRPRPPAPRSAASSRRPRTTPAAARAAAAGAGHIDDSARAGARPPRASSSSSRQSWSASSAGRTRTTGRTRPTDSARRRPRSALRAVLVRRRRAGAARATRSRRQAAVERARRRGGLEPALNAHARPDTLAVARPGAARRAARVRGNVCD